MRTLLLLVAALMPMQAAALSCLPWGVESAYQAAAKAEEAYVVAKGQLQFDASLVPEPNLRNPQDLPRFTRIPAQLRGYSMTEDGFENPFRTDLTLIVGCVGHWCAKPQPGSALAFLKRTEGGYELNSGACGGFVFSQPKQEALDRVVSCHSGGACKLPQR